jgi:hypothetical protein
MQIFFESPDVCDRVSGQSTYTIFFCTGTLKRAPTKIDTP